MSNTYPIKTTADEYTRLGIQSDLFRDDARAMLSRLGDGTGLHVLDYCSGTGGITDVLSEWVGPSGTVTGTDLDLDKLAYARDWVRTLGLQNGSFVTDDAFNSSLPHNSFDLVHARFALSVIQDGAQILDQMLKLTKPGGFVCVEEVNASTIECIPPTDDWLRAAQLMRDTFDVVGANVYLGPTLRETFRENGLEDVGVKLCMHAQTSSDPMTMHVPLTLEAMRETIVARMPISPQELDGLIKRVAEHLADPGTMSITFTMVQVSGRVPK